MGACTSSTSSVVVTTEEATKGDDGSQSQSSRSQTSSKPRSFRNLLLLGADNPESPLRSTRSLLSTSRSNKYILSGLKEPDPVRILVTGQPEGGCSTVVGHLRRVIYGEYTATELQHMAPPIQLYLNRLVAKLHQKAAQSMGDSFHGEITTSSIWADQTVKRLWKKYWKHELGALIDPVVDAEYFLDHAERILRADYIPTAADMAKFHFNTHKSQTYELDMPNSTLECTLSDVPMMFMPQNEKKQRRRSSKKQPLPESSPVPTPIKEKHFPIFDTVIYVVDLSRFDQYTPGKKRNAHHNELYKTLEYFRYYVNQPKVVDNTCLILVLNKKDLFAQKIKQGIHIQNQKCFSDYVGPQHSVADGLSYFMHLFRNSVQDNNRLTNDQIFVMTASDLDVEKRYTFRSIVEATQNQAAQNGKYSHLQSLG